MPCTVQQSLWYLMRAASVKEAWLVRSSTSRRGVRRSSIACKEEWVLNSGIPAGCLREHEG